jgi:hypothetical protein
VYSITIDHNDQEIKLKKLIQALVLSFAVLSTSVVVAEPTVKEIYQTAQTDSAKALTMIAEVIKNRPNSARAYYIQSELLLQSGKKVEAKAAFLKSQSLDPALSFARPESVERLRTALGIKKSGNVFGMDRDHVILWACGGLLVLLLLMFMARRKPRTPEYSPSYNLQNRPITPYTSSANVAPAGTDPTSSAAATPGSAQAPGAAQAPARSGMMGSLAQGAAMGVGVAAGATLVNHLLNGNKANAAPAETPPADPPAPSYVPDSNFGFSDSGGDWGGDSGGSDDSGGEW